MADDDAPFPDLAPHDLTPEAEHYGYPDHVLQKLVQIMNETGSQISVTVASGGRFLSGTLSSGRAYFFHLASRLEEGAQGSHEGVDAVVQLMQNEAAQYPDPEGDGADPGYLHLIDVWSEGDTFEVWRGRLADVEGWTLGVHQT